MTRPAGGTSVVAVDIASMPDVVVSSMPNHELELQPGHGSHPMFGTRDNIPNNTTVNVWAGPTVIRPLPQAPKPMFLASSSALDVYGGPSGAWLVLCTFIDENGDWRNSDLIPMTGLTNAAITYKPADGILGNASQPPAAPTPPGVGSIAAQVFRIIDAVVILAGGATESAPIVNNAGIISVRDNAAVVFETIPVGAGRSRSAAFHCPRNYEARLTYAQVGTARGQGTAYLAATYGLGIAWSLLPLSAVNSATATFDGDPVTTPISPRADLQAVITTGSSSIDATVILQVHLMPV